MAVSAASPVATTVIGSSSKNSRQDGGSSTPSSPGSKLRITTPGKRSRSGSMIPHPSPKSPPSPFSLALRGSPTRTTHRLSRTASLYTLSRSSFANQLTQLTSYQLPNAAELSIHISALATASEAASALSSAADQIKLWTRKAFDVLQQLDAQDDVEWAAAGATEGLEELAHSTTRFDKLVKVYVKAVEDMQLRQDITALSNDTLNAHVAQLESVIKDWQAVKERLKAIRLQEEIAIEWQGLSNNVLGDIQRELDSLGSMVFEMEEQRHRYSDLNPLAESDKVVGIDDLAKLVESRHETRNKPTKARLSIPPASSSPSAMHMGASNDQESNTVALFAKMQPLRASFDFLPIRLSTFYVRGNQLFPTACSDLESARDALEKQWKKLEDDSKALRKELDEDRWILVFRNAGKQALKMFESIERTQYKLKDTVRGGLGQTDLVFLSKTTESYKAKKMHYVPAVEKVLNIIDRGVMDRLTVNGEILRLQSDMKRRWSALQASMHTIDSLIEDSTTLSGQQLRDSVSSILSSEQSYSSSNGETKKSSPASFTQSRKGSFTHGSTTPTALSKSRIPRTSTLTPTALPIRSSALKSQSQRSVTSPSPRRSDMMYGRMSLNGNRYRDVSPMASHDIPPVPMLTPSPRKYSSKVRPAGGSRYSGVGPVIEPPSHSKLPPRSASSFGMTTDCSNINSKTRTPSGSQQQTPRLTTPSTAKRYGSFASVTESDESRSATGRLYPPSASRVLSRPSTSHGTRLSSSGSVYGRRSSLATTTLELQPRTTGRDSRLGDSRVVDKPRWHF